MIKRPASRPSPLRIALPPGDFAWRSAKSWTTETTRKLFTLRRRTSRTPTRSSKSRVVAAENPVKEAASLTMPPMDEESLNQARQQLSIHAAQLPASREGAVAGASDPLILAMMEQFSHLQQQLLAHTEQQMSMLTEMFSTLHKAQNDAVVEQLQQIQSITSELNELKAERRAANADAAAEQKADAANVSSGEQDTPVRAAGRPGQAPPEPVADAQQNAKVPHSGRSSAAREFRRRQESGSRAFRRFSGG